MPQTTSLTQAPRNTHIEKTVYGSSIFLGLATMSFTTIRAAFNRSIDISGWSTLATSLALTGVGAFGFWRLRIVIPQAPTVNEDSEKTAKLWNSLKEVSDSLEKIITPYRQLLAPSPKIFFQNERDESAEIFHDLELEIGNEKSLAGLKSKIEEQLRTCNALVYFLEQKIHVETQEKTELLGETEELTQDVKSLRHALEELTNQASPDDNRDELVRVALESLKQLGNGKGKSRVHFGTPGSSGNSSTSTTPKSPWGGSIYVDIDNPESPTTSRSRKNPTTSLTPFRIKE